MELPEGAPVFAVQAPQGSPWTEGPNAGNSRRKRNSPSIPSGILDPNSQGPNSPDPNSQGPNSPDLNSQGPNSPDPNSQGPNSPDPNSQGPNSPDLNSQGPNSPGMNSPAVLCGRNTLGPDFPTENPTSAAKVAEQSGDEEYDDDDGDASLTYFNFTHVLNPDDPLFENEQQVCRPPVRCISPDKRIICQKLILKTNAKQIINFN